MKLSALRRPLVETAADAVQIVGIDKEDIPHILKMAEEAFADVADADGVSSLLRAATDWSISKKAITDNRIIGFYLLSEDSVVNAVGGMDVLEDLSYYKTKNGVQGIALVVAPELRNSGIGKKLRNLPKEMGYDYVWGMQLKNLGNLGHWLKVRRLVAKSDDLYITLQDLVPRPKEPQDEQDWPTDL